MRVRLVPPDTSINFFGKSKWAIWLSGLGIALSALLYTLNGLNYGIDFRGGTMLMVKTAFESNISDLRSNLGKLNLGDTTVTEVSDPSELLIGQSDYQLYLIKIEQQPGNEEVQNKMIIEVKKSLKNSMGEIVFLQTESVGSKVS